jgi:formin 2
MTLNFLCSPWNIFRFVLVMKFYQFVPKGMKMQEASPKDFFAFWSPFCKDFKDIWKREQQKLIKEKIKEAKKKQEEKVNKVQKMKKGEGGLVSKVI